MVTNVSNSSESYVTGDSRGFSQTIYFKGRISELSTDYPNGTAAYCFAGADKGKAYILDAESATWEEIE